MCVHAVLMVVMCLFSCLVWNSLLGDPLENSRFLQHLSMLLGCELHVHCSPASHAHPEPSSPLGHAPAVPWL